MQAYEAGGFKISGEQYQGSVLVRAERTMGWSIAAFSQLDSASLQPLVQSEPVPEILVLGTGGRFEMITPGLRQAIRELGMVVEPMDTPAACRTFNVLQTEGRRVAAALIALPA